MFWKKKQEVEKPDIYAIHVWMRQVNERLYRLENNQVEASVSQRAEYEMLMEHRFQMLDAKILELQALLSRQQDNK